MIIENAYVKVIFDEKDGKWSLENKKNSRKVIQNAFFEIQSRENPWNSIGKLWQMHSWPYNGNLGSGVRYQVTLNTSTTSNPYLCCVDFIIYDALPIITVEMTLTNNTSSLVKIDAVSPCSVLASQNGGIFIGNSPKDSLVFENGLSAVSEFLLRSFNMEEESDSPWMIYLYSKPDGKENLLMGVIDKPNDICHIIINDIETHGITVKGQESIGEFRASKVFMFPKNLEPQDCLCSGVWMIRADSESGFDALENYADTVREYNRIRLWPYDVPAGWNSWGNPIDQFRNESYNHDIDENKILDNMNAAVKHFKPFGLKYWNIDDGWMVRSILSVDEVDMIRFPHGMKYIADKFHEQGLKAGIWINPFNAGPKSQLFKDHEKDGWFPEPDRSFPIKNTWRVMDLTVPGVQEYIRHYVRKVVKEWGFDLLKCDFTYFAMSPKDFQNPKYNGAEALRLGYKIIREEAGPDTFIFGIGGPIGLHWGDVDGERIGLDTLPRWGVEYPMGVGESGVEPSYRCFTRRYFMHNHLWLNHLDCLCFRGSLKRNESMCLANAMALLGGIWKIGDKVITMKPEDITIEQKMFPVFRQGARPVDIFRTLIPEILDLSIIKPSFQYHVVGVFHWGSNQDLISGEPMIETEKEVLVPLSDLNIAEEDSVHVFDFWEERYVGKFTTQFTTKLSPHHSKLFAIHVANEHPQFLSSNRHITQGGVEIADIHWNSDQNELHGTLEMVKGFEHKLFFHIPEGLKLKDTEFDKLEKVTPSMTGHILKIQFKCPGICAESLLKWKLHFEVI